MLIVARVGLHTVSFRSRREIPRYQGRKSVFAEHTREFRRHLAVIGYGYGLLEAPCLSN
jgi:hypothetical protein